MRPRLILIGGGSASGKTYLANKLVEKMGDELSIISLDNFYRNNVDLSFEERANYNYDQPDALDIDLIIEKFTELLKGKEIDIPVYDFSNHLRSDKTIHIKISKYIIIDGIFALYYPQLLKLADYKIYMDADEEVRLARRIKRDTTERGRTRDSVLKQFKETVSPMHNKYIEKTKTHADLIVNNNENHGINKTTLTRISNAILDIIK